MRHKPIPSLSRRIFNISPMRLICLCGLSCRFQQLSPSLGQVAYVLLTRSPLDARSIASDLHVLGTPPAFILSQDQTLHCLLFLRQLCVLFDSSFSYLFWRVYCSVFNVPVPSRRVLIYNTISFPLLQPFFSFFLHFFILFPFFALFIAVFSFHFFTKKP